MKTSKWQARNITNQKRVYMAQLVQRYGVDWVLENYGAEIDAAEDCRDLIPILRKIFPVTTTGIPAELGWAVETTFPGKITHKIKEIKEDTP